MRALPSPRALPRAISVLLLLGIGLIAATPSVAQGPLARTYAEHGFSAVASGDFDAAIREFTAALDLYPQYVDAYVGRAMAQIAQDRLLEAWGALEQAKRYDDDPARKAAVAELMEAIEVTARLEGYAAFLVRAKRDGDAIQVAEWTEQFRASLYTFPTDASASLGFEPAEVLKKYAADLQALGRHTEAAKTDALADAYLRHQLANWRLQQEEYAKEK